MMETRQKLPIYDKLHWTLHKLIRNTCRQVSHLRLNEDCDEIEVISVIDKADMHKK